MAIIQSAASKPFTNPRGSTRPHPAGPGLAVRVLGDVTEGDALDVLRAVDEVFIQTIREWGLYDRIWQAFAVFLPVRCALRSTSSQQSSHPGDSVLEMLSLCWEAKLSGVWRTVQQTVSVLAESAVRHCWMTAGLPD